MKIIIAPEFSHLSSFISQMPQSVDKGEGEVVYDGRNKVVKFLHDGKAFMIKRFKRVNIIQQVVYSFFRKTKAERAYLYADIFKERGISTPQPVAYMEFKRLGLFSLGFFVSLEAEGIETHRILRDVEDYDPNLAQAVAEQVMLLHSKGIMHGDLNLSNFLTTKDDKGYHFTMIDINRSKFCDGFPTDEQCLSNMVRLTHRRDLYSDLITRYARLRGWDEKETAEKALLLLNRFENKKRL